jgi:hypothetical protein
MSADSPVSSAVCDGTLLERLHRLDHLVDRGVRLFLAAVLIAETCFDDPDPKLVPGLLGSLGGLIAEFIGRPRNFSNATRKAAGQSLVSIARRAAESLAAPCAGFWPSRSAACDFKVVMIRSIAASTLWASSLRNGFLNMRIAMAAAAIQTHSFAAGRMGRSFENARHRTNSARRPD